MWVKCDKDGIPLSPLECSLDPPKSDQAIIERDALRAGSTNSALQPHGNPDAKVGAQPAGFTEVANALQTLVELQTGRGWREKLPQVTINPKIANAHLLPNMAIELGHFQCT
jgi:hypothetical protein